MNDFTIVNNFIQEPTEGEQTYSVNHQRATRHNFIQEPTEGVQTYSVNHQKATIDITSPQGLDFLVNYNNRHPDCKVLDGWGQMTMYNCSTTTGHI